MADTAESPVHLGIQYPLKIYRHLPSSLREKANTTPHGYLLSGTTYI